MQEHIIYVDNEGNPTGETEEKLAAHHAKTRKHLAFSCYVFNEDGKLLTTKRADAKKVWPRVWSNSFCGHPMPGENFEDAIQRRALFELGINIDNIECIKRDYSYETPLYDGIKENEFCPIFIAQYAGQLKPNPGEIGDYAWLDLDTYIDELANDTENKWSWWAKDQIKYVKTNPRVISLVL